MGNLNTSASSYPATLDTTGTLADGVNIDQIVAAHINGPTSALIAIETELGTLPRGSSTDVKTRLNGFDTSVTTLTNAVATINTNLTTLNLAAPNSYLSGLNISVATGSNTYSLNPGMATHVTTTIAMTLSSSLSKTTTTWAVGSGNGGLDTGVGAVSTWYHLYLIKRSDTAVVDSLFSLSAATPTMPASYTYKRRIGSAKTDLFGNWTAYLQNGDWFQWAVPLNDVNATAPGTAAVTRTLTVPTGVNVIWVGAADIESTTTGNHFVLITDLGTTDTTPSTTVFTFKSNNGGSTNEGSTQLQVRTDTSAQVRSRTSLSDAATVLNMVTSGWIDRRGRDN